MWWIMAPLCFMKAAKSSVLELEEHLDTFFLVSTAEKNVCLLYQV